jgi:CHAT domain-containing protein/tetratricopeptide (TPR) repeat protein
MLHLSRIFFAGVIVALTAEALPVAGQPTTTASQHSTELSLLLQRWKQLQDPDERIALGEQLLTLERAMASWPPDMDRQYVKADIQFRLGSAFLERNSGVRADNLERAMTHLEAALSLWTREAAPQDWAMAHNNLGMAYWARVQGQRVDNQDKAAAHFEAALTVFSRDVDPTRWAQLQNNLAVMYWNRMRGDRAENLERAIRHFEAALTVFTRATDPHRWAAAQNNLGSAYRTRRLGDRADNREKAITYLEAALTVFTRETYPHDWALAHNNLAIAYLDRVRGEQSQNREQAIAAFDKALTVFTREAYPQQWAQAHHNLGIAHAGRTLGERAANRSRAIGAYEAALSVFTRDVDPRQHLLTSRLLARTLLEAGDWHKAAPHFANAREAFLLLLGEGLEEAETRALIGEAGPMFAEAAFAAIRRGEADIALEIASEGRARLLTVALKVQTLDLPAATRKRVDELRGVIRSTRRAVETMQGVERAAAIEKLVALRQELLNLLKAAAPGHAGAASATAKARSVVGEGGTLVVPVVSAFGSSVLLVPGRPGHHGIRVVDLADDTSEQLFVLLRGPRNDPRLTGWLGAYFINQLQGDELNRRWAEWLAAIDGLGPELWRVFGAKLDAALKGNGITPGRRLVFLPPGELGILPLGLAQDPDTKRRLADDYEIVHAPSLEALAAAQSHAAPAGPATLAVVINPTGDLPGTEKEGKLVASYFPGKARTVLERNKATAQAVLAALKGKTHWHFASHGTFSWQDARQSALIMHGMERLSVGRLLEADGLGRPRLVVLSACETGLYDLTSNPDEFIGLPGTFTALGAAGVVGTLWPVSDAATALLIAKFYELYLEKKLSPPTALHRAQAWLRGATNGDLDAYAKAAASKGRLEHRHLAEIEQELSADGLARSRSSMVVQWTHPTTAPERKMVVGGTKHVARPYAHPYFWAGFVYTGL